METTILSYGMCWGYIGVLVNSVFLVVEPSKIVFLI